MASGVYPQFKEDILTKVHDVTNDALKLALLDSSHAFSSSDTVWGDISANEVSGTGYTAGGKTTGAVTILSSGTRKAMNHPNVSWASSTISADHGVEYNDDVSDKLIVSIDFGGTVSTTSQTFTFQVNASGVFGLD